MKSFNAVLAIHRGGMVHRFHTLPTVGVDTVASHSFGVAWLAYLLSGGAPTAELLVHCLRHDLAEYALGDVPSPVKKSLGMGEAFDKLEEAHLEKMGIPSPTLSVQELRIFKLADNLDGLRFCIAERNRGNLEMAECETNYRNYIQAMDPRGLELEVFEAINHMKLGG